MYLADTTVLSKGKYPEIFDRMEKNLRLSKNLYNAALFRIRQVFTGWEKEERTQNEEEVFRELRTMQAAYPKVKVGRVLSYRALDAVMRANNNPDFFAGLPMQTAQRVLKEAVTVFRAWLSSSFLSPIWFCWISCCPKRTAGRSAARSVRSPPSPSLW